MSSPRAELLFEEARRLLRAGDLDAASIQYEATLNLAPHHAEALHGLGVIAFKRGKLDRAIELMTRATVIAPGFGNAYFNLGNVFREMGQLERSAESYRQAVSITPDDAEGYFRLASVLSALGSSEEASGFYRQCLSLDASHAQAWAGLGFAQLKIGEAGAAVGSFKRWVELRPQDVDAIRSLAESQGQSGQFGEAAGSFRRLLEIAPEDLSAHLRLGLALEALDRLPDALEVLDKAVALAPNEPASRLARASVLRKLKRHQDALAAYDAILFIDPGLAEAYFQRGQALLEQAQPEAALENFEEAIEIDACFAMAHAARGDALAKLQRPENAILAYRQALKDQQGSPEIQNNFAVALHQAGRFEEALFEFEKALQASPGFALALVNYGSLLRDLRRLQDAVVALTRASAAAPDLAVAHRVLGDVYRIIGDTAQAINALERALLLDPGDAEAHMIYGHTLFDAGRFEEAVASYDRALALDSKLEFLPGLRLFTKLYVCNWDDFEAERNRLIEQVGQGELVCGPFASLVLFESLAVQQKIAKLFAQSRFRAQEPLSKLNGYRGHAKIRLGYFSADFFEHATTHLMAELFERHDRADFELIAISFGPDVHDAMRSRLERCFDQFHDVREQSDESVARLARELEIDIAVDLKGYTANYRPGIFVLGAAPIQASYLGYPGTLEMDAMHYLIADEVVVPEVSRAFYAEKIAYLPNSYQPNDSGRRSADVNFKRAELDLPDQAFVFCCFNNNFKLLPGMFACWMRILEAVPDSVLWLLGDNPVVIRNLRRHAEAKGIDGARLVFGKRLPVAEHLARHRAADLFLDSLPYNAHTTTSDALWMGLPVLTLAGESFASRVAASLLCAVNLPQLVTHSEEEYVETAVALARDRGRLADISAQLRLQRDSAPLFDIARFTSDLESLYREMQQRVLHGLPPETIGPLVH